MVRELDKEDLALLVQFVTGTSKVPLDGFKALQVRCRDQGLGSHLMMIPAFLRQIAVRGVSRSVLLLSLFLDAVRASGERSEIVQSAEACLMTTAGHRRPAALPDPQGVRAAGAAAGGAHLLQPAGHDRV